MKISFESIVIDFFFFDSTLILQLLWMFNLEKGSQDFMLLMDFFFSPKEVVGVKNDSMPNMQSLSTTVFVLVVVLVVFQESTH